MRLVILFLLVAGLLAGCAADPRDAAEAVQIRLEAEAEANARAQELQQKALQFELKHAEAEATSAQLIASMRDFIRYTFGALTIGAVGFILAAAVGLSWGTVGAGRAAAEAVHVRANLVPLDVATRQYPLYLQKVSRDRYTLTDMNTGQVKLLDLRDAGDRQLIATAGAVRLAGAVAYESRRSSDPAGVAIIGTNPAIVAPREYQALPQPAERVERFEVIPQPVAKES